MLISVARTKLDEFAKTLRARDAIVFEAFTAGLTKTEISERTGFARSTIVEIIKRHKRREPQCSLTFPHDTRKCNGPHLPSPQEKDAGNGR